MDASPAGPCAPSLAPPPRSRTTNLESCPPCELAVPEETPGQRLNAETQTAERIAPPGRGLAPATTDGKVPVGKRQKGIRLLKTCAASFIHRPVCKVQTDVAFSIQPLAVDSLEPRIARLQRHIDHFVDRLPEAVILKPHPLREPTKRLNIRPAFPQRLNRLSRYLQKVMPVSCLQIFVLEKRRGWQNDIRVIRSVRKELFMDDGKKIPPLQPADHLVVIGTHRRRIRVVHKQCLHRWILEAVQCLPQFHHVYNPRRAA